VLQTVSNALLWGWAGALVVAAAWFLTQTYGFEEPWRSSAGLLWGVVGGVVLAATALAAAYAAWRAPSKLAAALTLDERFDLRERVTTSLTLAPGQEATPAGQALLEDVNQRLRDLDVSSRFPMRVSRQATLVAGGAALCAAAAVFLTLFFPPASNVATASNSKDDAKEPPRNPSTIDQKMNELKKTNQAKPPTDREKPADLRSLEEELDKIASKPRDTKEEVRERIKEMTALEDNMKGREKELADKARSLKQQLQRLDQMAQSKENEGPAKELQKALAEGKFDKAREQVESLQKRLEKGELSAKEKEQLKEQLQKMKEKLDRLAQQKDKEEELKRANLDPETLQRELDNLKKESAKLNGLEDLAKQMAKCQQCLKEGNMEGAAESLSKAGEQLKELAGEESDLKDLQDQLQRLQDCKSSCCKGCDGDREGEPVDSDMLQDSKSGGPGAGRRPDAKGGPTKSYDARARAEFDPKGKKIFSGYAPGQNFKKKSSADIAGEIKQASQEASEAIEHQPIPRAARETVKGYYQKMREQADKDAKKGPQP
jgi:hypothetical protein